MRIALSGRRVLAVVAALLALVASAGVAYRVLAPAEVVTPARLAYPPNPDAAPGVIGTLNAAPLIVDGRLRVYATTRRVWADQPVDAATRRTPYWAFRRWPAQLVGVVASGTMVVSRWSDGELVALDARTGRVAWQTTGPDPQHGYMGRRTGASTVYEPAGLHTARTGDGRDVLLLVDKSGGRGIDPVTGRELWRFDGGQDCRTHALTTTAGQLATVDQCANPPAVEFRDAGSGEVTGRWRPDGADPQLTVEPLGCRVARSDCPAIRTTTGTATDGSATGRPSPDSTVTGRPSPDSTVTGRPTPDSTVTGPPTPDSTVTGWLTSDTAAPAAPVGVPALDEPESTLVDGVVVAPEGGQVVGRPVSGDGEAWRWPEAARILAVQPGRVHLRGRSRELVTVDARTGAELSRFPLTQGRDSIAWSPGLGYATDGFVAVERLAEPVDLAADDSRYYLSAQPVILAAT